MTTPFGRAAGLALAALWTALAPCRAEAEGADGSAEAAEEELPLAAARYYRLAEPMGRAPAPWAALSAGLDAGVGLDGEAGWTSLRVHIPVARRYGAVDARLTASFSDQGLDVLAPEFTLRGMPLQLAGGRGVLGFSFTFLPYFQGEDPLIVLGGGLMGGYLGERWFAWAHLGARGEVLERGRPELETTLAVGLRLPHGLRPQVEVDLRWQMHEQGDLSLAIRPGLRYWPAEFIGIGLSADIWALGPEVAASAIRLDVIVRARE